MTQVPEAIFGESGASHIPLLVEVLENIGSHDYKFMANSDFDVLLHENWREAQQIYWLEILYRAHFAASTSLIRTSRWIDAMLALAEEPNYTAFMAAYRGCLESAADSFHTFGSVAGWLAELHAVIRLAVAGRVKQPTVCKDLEDELIHFTHARHVRKEEEVDDSHRAKHTTAYLKALVDAGTPGVMECYRTLCDVTHPGIGSVRCYADGYRTKTGTGYRLRLDLDDALIREFCKDSERISERMIHFGVVPPIMVLRILNEFGVGEVHTPGVMNIGVERQPDWQPFAARLEDDRPPEAQELDLEGRDGRAIAQTLRDATRKSGATKL